MQKLNSVSDPSIDTMKYKFSLCASYIVALKLFMYFYMDFVIGTVGDELKLPVLLGLLALVPVKNPWSESLSCMDILKPFLSLVMCSLTACRFIEPFTNAADCQPSGPKFDMKNKDRLLQAAKRAEIMLTKSSKDRIEAMGVKPVVVLTPLSREQLSTVPGVSVTDDSATDIEPEGNTKTEEAPVEKNKFRSNLKLKQTDKPQAADVNDFLTSVAKAKYPKTAKSVARKKISVKSGDVSTCTAGKRDGTGSVEEPRNSTGIMTASPASTTKAKNPKIAHVATNEDKGNEDKPHSVSAKMNCKRRASVREKDSTDEPAAKRSSQLDASSQAFKQQDDLASISPNKCQKMQKFDSAESQAVANDETVMDVASSGTGSAIVSHSQEVILQPHGEIKQFGGRVSRGRYANVGNRELRAEHAVSGGFPVSRGRGRGRAKASGSIGVTSVSHQNVRITSSPMKAETRVVDNENRLAKSEVASHGTNIVRQSAIDSVNRAPAKIIRKHKASDDDKNDTDEHAGEHSSQLNVEGRSSPGDVNMTSNSTDSSTQSPQLMTKLQQSGGVEQCSGPTEVEHEDSPDDIVNMISNNTGSSTVSPQLVSKLQQSGGVGQHSGPAEEGSPDDVINMTSPSTASSVLSPQVMRKLQPSGGSGQHGGGGGRVSCRHYANVGNRVVPVEYALQSGFPVLRGRGRGRPRGRVDFTTVYRNEHYGTGDGASACGVPQRGLPIRGRGRPRVVGSRMPSVCQQPNMPVTGASVGNSQVLKPLSNSDCEYHIL